ncbi:hypothetical protein ACODT5_40295 [Streptomyces sp. 5.8]|uniref:hypothetical protein n=1 Tax=Streptomyces sp. 5.8 TaxID=3406571 RepID=UPI003BB4F739
MANAQLLNQDVLSAHLRSWAEAPELSSRKGELDALADALAGKGSLDPWTELDLVAAYARQESLTAGDAKPGTRWLVILEIVLGVMVFIPLLITWFGLGRASAAYGELIRADPDQAGRPFLQLWQGGFEGRLAGWLTFGHVATAATVAIAGLLVISVVHAVKRARAAGRVEAAEQRVQNVLTELLPLLTRIQLVLNSHRLSSPQRFAAELSQAARRLGKLTTRTLETQETLREAAESVVAATEAATQNMTSLEGLMGPLIAAVTRVEDVVRENAEQVAATAVTVAGAGADTREGMEKLAEAVGTQLEQIGARIEGVVRENVEQVAATAVTVAGVGADTRESVAKLAGSVATKLELAGERIEDAVSDLAAAQRGFTTGTELVADITGQALNALRESVGRLDGIATDVRRGADLAQASAMEFAAGVTAFEVRSTSQLTSDVVPPTDTVADQAPHQTPGVHLQKEPVR